MAAPLVSAFGFIPSHSGTLNQEPSCPGETQTCGDQFVRDCATFDISHQVTLLDPEYDPTATGGFSEVFRGKRGSTVVAMKRLDAAKVAPEALKRQFIRECKLWHILNHPNVLEFYGVMTSKNSVFMISPYLENGTARKWLESNRDQSLRVLVEATQGCHYLHSLAPDPIVHGDINGANILIAADGHAVLSDFGLSKMMNTLTSQGLNGLGTSQFMAPELFKKLGGPMEELKDVEIPVTKTLGTDVFAFGRTVLELLSGQLPFGLIADKHQDWHMAQQGWRPTRPNTPAAERWITGEIWNFIEEMTDHKPESRPTMSAVEAKLREFQDTSS